MTDFGFSISKPRSIDLDTCDLSMNAAVESSGASFRSCIGCGGCTASCSAGQFTDFNIRRTHTLFRRGQYDGLEKALNNCMLCGKCFLVCPRSINLRRLIIQMRQSISSKDPYDDLQDYLNEL